MVGIRLAARTRLVLDLGALDESEASSAIAPEAVRDAAIAALRRGETHYTDRPGIAPLRERVSALLAASCGVVSDPGRDVLITCGATEARFVAIQRLVEPGAALLYLGSADPVAGAVAVRGAALLGIDPEPSPEDLAAVTTLYLPARGVAAATRERWLREAVARGWWLIFDLDIGNQADHPGQDDHPGTDATLTDRTVTVGGIGHGAGLESWRVGYLVAPGDGAPQLRNFKQALTICTTNLSQWAALALLEAQP